MLLKRLYRDFYDRLGRETAAAGGAGAAAFSKSRGYAVRFALVHHLAGAADPGNRLGPAAVREIGAGSMRAGIEIAERYRHEAVRVPALLGETRADAARDVQRAFRDVKAADAGAAPDGLAGAGLGRWRSRPTTAAGRPTREFAPRGRAGDVPAVAPAGEKQILTTAAPGDVDPFARQTPASEDVPPAAAA